MKKLILAVPLLIIVSIVTAIMLLLLNRWFWGIAVLILIFILNWWSETFALNLFRKERGEYDFRVLTYNINRAHEISVNKGSTEELIAFILGQNADIVLLQEYNADLYPLVEERLSREYPYGSGVDATSRFKSVFSRFPIESCEQLSVDAEDSRYELFQNAIYCKKKYDGKEILPICKLVVHIGDKKLQIFNCHLMSNNYSVVIRNLRKKGRSIIRGILPILHRIDFGYKVRELQARLIGENADSDLPTVVCGDMNDVGGSSPLRILKKYGFSDAWWRGSIGFGFTFYGMGLRFRLDHILYSETFLRLKKSFIPHSDASDHVPLICDFVFET